MKKPISLSCIVFLFITCVSSAQTDTLRKKIENIISGKKAVIGVSISGIESKDTLTINGSKHFPMQSVYKFHIALTVLNQIDQGKLSFDQKIFIKKSDLITETWSPLREKYPNGNINLTLREILKYTVSESDNTGCDLLLKLLGGTGIVNNYMHSIGIRDVNIQASEEEMHKAWDVQFTNWTTPISAMQLLRKFYNKEVLSEKSYDFLWNLMLGSYTFPERIIAELPTGTILAHKTGSSGTNSEGLTAATNDIGIVCLPNGKHFAICVFVSNSYEDDKTNAKIIAEIAKVVWDYFLIKYK